MRQKEFIQSIKKASPIVLGYVPIGLAFGVMAVQQGLTILEIFLMSLLVYAGSAQFIAAGMMAAQASIGGIIATTFLVNLRHLLMSASLSPYLKGLSPLLQSVISFGITDETFAVGITEVKRESWGSSFFLGLHFTSHLSWIISTVLGGVLGNLIPNPDKLGLDYALPAMFIGLLLMQMNNLREVLVALFSGALSIGLLTLLDGNWNIILATIIGATVGVVMEGWKKKSSLPLSG